MRSLSPEEAALWAKVTATIRPLSREIEDAPPGRAAVDPPVEVAKSGVLPPRPPQSRPRRAETLQTATLDGGWDRRLRTGRIEPDRVLDLHGHNLERAWEAVDRALEQAERAGERVLLLITGHERKGDPPLERGRIRAVVHDWLAHSRHSSRIAAVRNAHRRHGGGGSLYVILRRI